MFEETNKESNKSLSVRLRPENIEEFIGQEHILAKDKPLRRVIEKGLPVSIIMYGPPGSGKTTLGYIIAKSQNAEVELLNAVTSRVEDIRRIREESKNRLNLYKKRTILFIDEIHRFNKAQQDALLDDVENNIYTIIGVTTLNPAFYIIPPLISRCLVFRLEVLTKEEIKKIIKRALMKLDKENFFATKDECIEFIIEFSGGDARVALNILEIAILCDTRTLAELKNVVPYRMVRYDRDGDYHYDIVSAFIKSLRGSNPDAALYWLARMLESGEDPRFITRRMIIFASEDIGNADPQALNVACNASLAFDIVGLPEARINLAQAVTYLATAPKSNASYLAIEEALKEIKKDEQAVPQHLRTGDFFNKRGEDYLYPHSFSEGFVKQNYMQNEKIFYRPTNRGYEKIIKERLDKWREKKKDQ
ncbi:MAG: replication-associated recombination protein A [Candidatus Hydrogenedentota bacterium]